MSHTGQYAHRRVPPMTSRPASERSRRARLPLRLLLRSAAWLPAAAWAYLLVGRGHFWSTSTRLPPRSPRGTGGAGGGGTVGAERNWPPVAIVVPARDEADLLPHTLPTLLAQDYPGPAQVVLVDDRSADGTAARAALWPTPPPLPSSASGVVAGQPRPPGWAGKPWAMAQGRQRPWGRRRGPNGCCSPTRTSPIPRPRCAGWWNPPPTTPVASCRSWPACPRRAAGNAY